MKSRPTTRSEPLTARQSPVLTDKTHAQGTGEIVRVVGCRICKKPVSDGSGYAQHLEASPDCRRRIDEWLNERTGW